MPVWGSCTLLERISSLGGDGGFHHRFEHFRVLRQVGRKSAQPIASRKKFTWSSRQLIFCVDSVKARSFLCCGWGVSRISVQRQRVLLKRGNCCL